jgi:hypothetical protein
MNLTAPLMVGPINLEPFVMGEAAHWQQGFTAQHRSLSDEYGIRARYDGNASLPVCSQRYL